MKYQNSEYHLNNTKRAQVKATEKLAQLRDERIIKNKYKVIQEKILKN